MTISEFYDLIGGDYEDIISRLYTDERIIKFLKLFLRDTSYQELRSCMQKGEWEEAFRAAHTLKGVAQNLSMNSIIKAAGNITEALRIKNIELAKQLLPNVENTCDKVYSLLAELLESTSDK